ncbi:MAG: S9 family peptidase [Bacteroidales bacterium]|nr:S9 family peptidase [Bacteroidales bacterium]
MKKNSSIIAVIFLLLFANRIAAQTDMTLENIFKSGKLRAKGVYGMNSLKDGERYLRIEQDTLYIYSYKTGEQLGVMATGEEINQQIEGDPVSLYGYQLSSDEKQLLLASDEEAIYRRSSKAHYYIFNVDNKKVTKLMAEDKVQNPVFSPDGKKVAFVENNNLVIRDLELQTSTRVTVDGKRNAIINGTTDWVYEEEFGFTDGFQWSPDGSFLAFYRFDESQVKEFQMTMYNELYPEEYRYKYPKAGEDNSLIEIQIYNVKTGKVAKVDLGTETDIYVPRIRWAAQGNTLAVYRMNRLQNHLEILAVNAVNNSQTIIYNETNQYYIDITDDFVFTPDGKNFILTSEKSGYNHIYLYDMNGLEIKQLTTGEFDVTAILGYNADKKLVYYQAAQSSPLNREVFAVDMKGKIQPLETTTGTNQVTFSNGCKYYILNWSDANTPPVYTMHEANGKLLRTLEDNAAMRAKMQEYGFAAKDFFSFTTAEGYSLNGFIIKPKGWKEGTACPTLFNNYGGPGSQTVVNSWKGGDLWNRYLAQEGIMVVAVDNRGTGFRGEQFKKMTYLQLGKYETEDQILAAKYLIEQGLSDAKHIGVFGWSYGGYMSTLCMTKGADYFSTGIAVAPVTNWRYYDNIYTERFMRTPQENPDGYDDNSPIHHVEKMKGKYLLVHGTADDNVHCQNSVDLITALVNADVDFEMFFYPNSNHGIYTGRNTTFHLYKKMTNFLKENLLQK